MHYLCAASQGIVLCMASYAILVSIVPQSLDPLIPIQPLKPKYITPVTPFMAYVAILAMDQLLKLLARPQALRRIYIAANSMALVFLAYTFSDNYPHTYRIKTSQWMTAHPSAEAIYWKHNKLAQGLSSDTGVCASRTAPLRWTNLFLIKFFNVNGSAERMHVSRPGNRRILHSTDLSLEDLNRYVKHNNLFEFVELTECPEKKT